MQNRLHDWFYTSAKLPHLFAEVCNEVFSDLFSGIFSAQTGTRFQWLLRTNSTENLDSFHSKFYRNFTPQRKGEVFWLTYATSRLNRVVELKETDKTITIEAYNTKKLSDMLKSALEESINSFPKED